MVVGASLSLTGAFRRQGEQALAGLQSWSEHAARPGDRAARLVVLDDGSRAQMARDNVERLLDREGVDCLVGPYSSGLVLAVAPLAETRGVVLWNHGGSSDALFEQGWRHLVSLPSPASDYFRALPAWVRQRRPEASRLAILSARAGTFAPEVARGAAEAARAAGFDVVQALGFDSPLAPSGVLAALLDPEPDLLIGVGRFEDDVTLVRHRARLPGRTMLAVVGAGLADFRAEVGDLAEGVIGPSQWEPNVPEEPELGPGSASFCEVFEHRFGRSPEYPAAQAFAVGLVLAECLRRAGSLETAPLLAAAHALDTTTLYGRFRLDPRTGRQLGHRVLLIEWRGGRKLILPTREP